MLSRDGLLAPRDRFGMNIDAVVPAVQIADQAERDIPDPRTDVEDAMFRLEAAAGQLRGDVIAGAREGLRDPRSRSNRCAGAPAEEGHGPSSGRRGRAESRGDTRRSARGLPGASRWVVPYRGTSSPGPPYTLSRGGPSRPAPFAWLGRCAPSRWQRLIHLPGTSSPGPPHHSLRGGQRERHDAVVGQRRIEEAAAGRRDDHVLLAVLAEIGARGRVRGAAQLERSTIPCRSSRRTRGTAPSSVAPTKTSPPAVAMLRRCPAGRCSVSPAAGFR